MNLNFTSFSIKLVLFIILSFNAFTLTHATTKLDEKKQLIDKYFKTKNTFEKKVKLLVVFQEWADKEVLSHSDKLSDDELTQIMQYSNLLKALSPSKLTVKNCKSASAKILDEDSSPLNEKTSPPAQTILGWLKILCPK